MLKFKTKTVHEIGWNDFDDFIRDEYGHDYEIAVALESHNDTTHSFVVDGCHFEIEDKRRDHLGLNKFDQEDLDAFVSSGFSDDWPNPSIFLNDQVAKGNIPAGEYQIDISW